MRGPNGPIPMTVAEIAIEAGLSGRRCAYALGELIDIGLLELQQPECYFIPKFTEKTETSTERVRKHRMKRVSETLETRFGNGDLKQTEVEEEIEKVTSLPTVETPPSAPAQPRSQRLRLRTDAETVADEAIELLAPRIRPVLHGMTWTKWRAVNRKHVVDMATSGMTAAEIDAAHLAQSEAFGSVIFSIPTLQKRFASASASQQIAEEPRHPTRAEILRAEAERDGISWEDVLRQEAERAGG